MLTRASRLLRLLAAAAVLACSVSTNTPAAGAARSTAAAADHAALERTSASQPRELRAEIENMDSALFAAFNAQDLTALQRFFAPDLEFYQDNEGLENFAETMRDFSEMFRQPTKIRRELIPGSLEVYPIKNYGAIEVGSHRFCHGENGKTECGTFKFVHVWRKTGTSWQLSRVVSYAH